jgi:hypothetical protein
VKNNLENLSMSQHFDCGYPSIEENNKLSKRAGSDKIADACMYKRILQWEIYN